MYLFQTYKKAYFHVSKCGISYKINLIYSRSTIEPTSVPCYCASVERTLDIGPQHTNKILWTGQMLKAEILRFILNIEN